MGRFLVTLSECGLRYKQGFTLVEVLVSMVILAIGLLGLAALQGRALKDNQDAYFYSQANLLAYEMGDRIKANKAYWGILVDTSGVSYLNGMPDSDSTKSCSSADESCTPTEMAAADLKYWEDSAVKVLPAPTGYDAKLVDIQRSSDIDIEPCKKRPSVVPDANLCLITTWARASNRTPNSTSSADMIYRFEVTPQ